DDVDVVVQRSLEGRCLESWREREDLAGGRWRRRRIRSRGRSDRARGRDPRSCPAAVHAGLERLPGRGEHLDVFTGLGVDLIGTHSTFLATAVVKIWSVFSTLVSVTS